MCRSTRPPTASTDEVEPRARAAIRSRARARRSCAALGVPAAERIARIETRREREIDAALAAARRGALARAGRGLSTDVQDTGAGGGTEVALMTYAAGRAAGAGRGDARRRARGRAGRGRRARRHLRPVPGLQQEFGAAARHRHADLGGDHHGRRRRHGADRPATGGRDARRRFRAVRASTRSSTRRRRTATCSAARAACRWWRACRSASGARRPRSTRSRSRPGSRTCRAWSSSRRRRRRTTTRCSHAAIACDDPVIYMEHKELWGSDGEVDARSAPRRAQARAACAGRDAI